MKNQAKARRRAEKVMRALRQRQGTGNREQGVEKQVPPLRTPRAARFGRDDKLFRPGWQCLELPSCGVELRDVAVFFVAPGDEIVCRERFELVEVHVELLGEQLRGFLGIF